MAPRDPLKLSIFGKDVGTGFRLSPHYAVNPIRHRLDRLLTTDRQLDVPSIFTLGDLLRHFD